MTPLNTLLWVPTAIATAHRRLCQQIDRSLEAERAFRAAQARVKDAHEAETAARRACDEASRAMYEAHADLFQAQYAALKEAR
jgi:hypothetical protein